MEESGAPMEAGAVPATIPSEVSYICGGTRLIRKKHRMRNRSHA